MCNQCLHLGGVVHSVGGHQESNPQAPKVCDYKCLENQLTGKGMRRNCEVDIT